VSHSKNELSDQRQYNR